MSDTVITRMAPSPTGFLHVGTARAALYNFLYARKHGGEFIMRIEDTDKARSKQEYEDEILDGFKWLGIDYDRLEHQSKRTDVYTEAIKHMLDSNTAYLSKEQKKDNPEETVEVVRLRNPGKEITFKDEVRGDITFDTTELGDFVIARSIDDPLYHLTVVVDDEAMGVTHVIRGEDHISNTPRQILIQEALGYARPIYAHMPLLLGKDKSKLSKRHGAQTISDFKDRYLPEAVINYLALLGWNPGTDQEIFSLEELIASFDLPRIQKGGAIFDTEKLDNINHEHLKRLGVEKVAEILTPQLSGDITRAPLYTAKRLEQIVSILLERHKTTTSMVTALEDKELRYLLDTPSYSKESLLFKGKGDLQTAHTHLTHAQSILSDESLPLTDPGIIKGALWDYATEHGRGDVLWPLRMALSGVDRSPDPFTLTSILGREESIKRILFALEKI